MNSHYDCDLCDRPAVVLDRGELHCLLHATALRDQVIDLLTEFIGFQRIPPELISDDPAAQEKLRQNWASETPEQLIDAFWQLAQTY